MIEPDESWTRAEQDGEAAQVAGLDDRACPYSVGSRLHAAWVTGWTNSFAATPPAQENEQRSVAAADAEIASGQQ